MLSNVPRRNRNIVPISGHDEAASKKERFEFLYQTLTTFYTGLIDFEFKQASLLVVGIGWLISAQTAQTYFASHLLAQIAATVVVLMLTLFHTQWVAKFYQKSEATFAAMISLNFVPTSDFENLHIRFYLPATFVCMHGTLTLFAIVLIWNPS